MMFSSALIRKLYTGKADPGGGSWSDKRRYTLIELEQLLKQFDFQITDTTFLQILLPADDILIVAKRG